MEALHICCPLLGCRSRWVPDGLWANCTVAVLLLVGPIGTLFVPVAHEAVVDAAAVVLAAEVDVLLARI